MASNDLAKCLRALAAGDEGPDADRARKFIKKLGGTGTASEARAALDALGEPVVDPDEEKRDEIRARMGGVTSAMSRGIHWDPRHPHDRVFPVLTSVQAREHLLRRARAGDRDADAALARNRGRR